MSNQQSFSYKETGLPGFSQIKDREPIEQNLHSVAGVMPQEWVTGTWGYWAKK